MKLKLGDICEIQPGLYLKPSDRQEYSAVFVNLRDFDENHEFTEPSAFVNLDEVKNKYIIKKDDILFSTRVKFNAYRLPVHSNQMFVASNSFAILKLRNRKLLPDYLSWFINHPDREPFYALRVQGSNRIPYISTSELAEMEIDLPDLETQKLIGSIDSLLKKEKRLTAEILEKRYIYIQTLLSQKIKK
ncbi:MAG: restriction endonuclease subunit S [Moheibacter sp.]